MRKSERRKRKSRRRKRRMRNSIGRGPKRKGKRERTSLIGRERQKSMSDWSRRNQNAARLGPGKRRKIHFLVEKG